jgi:Type I phosphodiesterase / nucleotide pyrophosphatase
MDFRRPDYGGYCLDSLLAVLGMSPLPSRMPDHPLTGRLPKPGAQRTLLFVVDGLGYSSLTTRAAIAPALNAHLCARLSGVFPTSTPAALTTLTTSTPPGIHGIVGQRVPVRLAPPDGWAEFDVLRSGWRQPPGGRARTPAPVLVIQDPGPFGGLRPYVISKRKHLGTGFTALHLGRDPDATWKMPSAMLVEVARALRDSRADIYLYYDGLDTTAHHHGFGEHYDAELSYIDSVFARLLDLVPAPVRLVVTADHGCVPVTSYRCVPDEISQLCALVGGEDRNTYLIARSGQERDLEAAAKEYFQDTAWVMTRAEAVAAGLYGPSISDAAFGRIGDVRVFPFPGHGIREPGGGERAREPNVCSHGSLSADELDVPLVAA